MPYSRPSGASLVPKALLQSWHPEATLESKMKSAAAHISLKTGGTKSTIAEGRVPSSNTPAPSGKRYRIWAELKAGDISSLQSRCSQSHERPQPGDHTETALKGLDTPIQSSHEASCGR